MVYRAPNTNLALLNCNGKTVYLCGDFNVDLLQHENQATNNFIDHLCSYGLHPLITKHSATLIDTFFTTELHKSTVSDFLINDLSDHLPIFQICDYADNFHQIVNRSFRIRSIDGEQLQAFINTLAIMKWDEILNNDDVNSSYKKFIEM